MNSKKAIAIALPIIVTALLLAGCVLSNKLMGPGGTAWAVVVAWRALHAMARMDVAENTAWA